MEYIQENQILLYEELCGKPVDEEDRIVKATILFRKNIRLANKIASKFSIPYDACMDRDDIIQCAYEGLWKSCLGFNESYGLAFSTYAVPMIKGQILRMLRDNEALKTPRSFKDIRSALLKHNFSLPLSDEEVNVLIEEGVASKSQIMRYVDIDMVSFDAPAGGKEDNRPLAEVIPDEYYEDLGFEIREEEIEKIIDKVLVYIKPIHRDLVEEWMYATLEGYKITQGELGEKYNISQVSVSRILKSAIEVVKMHGDEIRDLFGF